ncbi:hypothetical protein SK224_16420, partial [Microbacterium sp. BG28]|uniref:hypothetical protein n=1 Tax=Microbacterium sp. BG28 TaxID=3097356 RepID=UPI002A59D73B
MMPQDIYSKAGADAAFVHDSPEGREALAGSTELSAAIGGKIADDVPPLITEQAAPLVDAAITAADIPGQASDAVEAD